jgi:hypothetical protein
MKTINLMQCPQNFLPGIKTFCLFFCLLLFSACEKNESADSSLSMETVALDMTSPPPAEEKLGMEGLTQNFSYNKESEATDKTLVNVKIPEKIKKTAVINLTVDDYKSSRFLIEKIVKAGNGYIAGENEQNNTYSISNTMVIRVKNQSFEGMVSNITAIPAHVNSKNIYTEDVTAEYVDITARLKSKKEVEKRYLELLQKAVKVSDILEVEEQLNTIREEIEAKEGQLKYLNDQVDYSTINLSFHQDFEYTPTDRPGFFGRIGTAFGNGWNNFLSFLIDLIHAWPVLIGIFGGIYLLYRFIKKRFKK